MEGCASTSAVCCVMEAVVDEWSKWHVADSPRRQGPEAKLSEFSLNAGTT